MQIVTIRDRKGQGNNALYVRLRNSGVEYWNFTTSLWVASEVSDCRVFLAEYPDGSSVESRYQSNIILPAGDLIIEYVRLLDGFVLGEESINGGTTIQAGTGPNLVTVTALDGTSPVAGVLVQAWVGGAVVASALTDATGQVGLGLEAGSVELILTRTSWGTFPHTVYTVTAGPQSVSVQGTASPPLPEEAAAFGVAIQVGDVNARLRAGYSTIEVQCSDNENVTWRALTAPTASPPRLTSSAAASFRVGGLSVSFVWEGTEYSVTFSAIFPDYTPSQIATVFNQVLPGVASVSDSAVVLTGLTTGADKFLQITSVSATALGFTVGQIDYGEDVHIALVPDTFLYSYYDTLGTTTRRYRWRFSDNGGTPISAFAPWVYGTQVVTGVPVSFGYLRMVDVSGGTADGAVFIHQLDPYNQNVIVPNSTKTFRADNQGFVYAPLMQGAKVRVAVEGTSIVRDITVPTAASFDLMQALSLAPDPFTAQTVPPLLNRRSL